MQKCQGLNTQADIEKIDNELIKSLNPKIYTGAAGEEVKFINKFAEACAIINQASTKPAQKMTVHEFYTTLVVLERQQKQKKKKTESGKPYQA